MNANRLLFAWAVAATVIAALLALNPGQSDPEPSDRDNRESPDAAADESTDRSDGTLEDSAAVQTLRAAIASLRAERDQARSDREAARATISELRTELTQQNATKRVTVTDVVAMLDALKGKGLSALVNPAETSKLLSDLRALGGEGVDLLLAMIDSETATERMLAAKLLGDLADGRAIDALAEAAADENERVRMMASQALALMGDPAAAQSLRRVLDGAAENDVAVRINSLFGLCKLGEAQAISEAREFLASDSVPDGQNSALANGLLLLDTPAVLPAVRTLSGLDKSSAQLGAAVVRYLEKIRTDVGARNLLGDIIGDTSYPQSVRDLAAQVLNM